MKETLNSRGTLVPKIKAGVISMKNKIMFRNKGGYSPVLLYYNYN